MNHVRAKTTIRMRMQGDVRSHSRTDVAVRDLTQIIDEPIERGGTNLGMSPTETLVASLIGCTSVISHKIAHKNGIELQDMVVRAEVDFDRRGVLLTEEVEVPFPALTLTVDVRSDASIEQIDQLRLELSRFCAISKVIKASGTAVTEVWNVTPTLKPEKETP